MGGIIISDFLSSLESLETAKVYPHERLGTLLHLSNLQLCIVHFFFAKSVMNREFSHWDPLQILQVFQIFKCFRFPYWKLIQRYSNWQLILKLTYSPLLTGASNNLLISFNQPPERPPSYLQSAGLILIFVTLSKQLKYQGIFIWEKKKKLMIILKAFHHRDDTDRFHVKRK